MKNRTIILSLFACLFAAVPADAGLPIDCEHVTRRAGPAHEGVAVLEYHHFLTNAYAAAHPAELTDMTMSAAQLEAQLAWLAAQHAHPLTVPELLAHISGAHPAPPRSFVITIDDGYESVYTVAWPVLKKHGFPADLALIVLATEDPHQWQTLHPGALPHLSWTELAAMRPLVTVDSHTYNKHDKLATIAAGLPEAQRPAFYREVTADLVLARQLIQRRTGTSAERLIWPHGDASPALERAAAEAGHTATFYGAEELISVHADPMEIGRLNAGSGLLTLDGFVALLHKAGWR